MAYFTHTVDPIGCFDEKEYGNPFEYSVNNDPLNNVNEDCLHKIWIGDVVHAQGYRYGTVKKTVAYIVVDEDEFGLPVIEKWNIKRHRNYSKKGVDNRFNW